MRRRAFFTKPPIAIEFAHNYDRVFNPEIRDPRHPAPRATLPPPPSFTVILGIVRPWYYPLSQWPGPCWRPDA